MNILKIINYTSILTIFIGCLLSSFKSFAQCENFSVSIQEIDNCNSNGIIEVVYIAPFDVDVLYPNGSSIIISSNQDTLEITGLAGSVLGSSYTVTTLDTFLCSQTISLTSSNLTTGFFTPNVNQQNGYAIGCFGDCDATTYLSFQNPTEPYTINWYLDSISGLPLYSNSTNILSPHQIQQSNLCAGNYFLEFISESGCVTTREFIVRQPDSLQISASLTDVLCSGGSTGAIDISVSGGVGDVINNLTGNVINTLDYNYNWSGPNGFTSNDEDIIDLTSGNYTIEVTDNNGCISQNSFTIADTNSPIVLELLSQDSVQCFGSNDGLLQVSASGGVGTFEFSIDNVNWQSTGTFDNLLAGNYDIYARDGNGCIGVGTFEVFTYPQLTISATSDTIFCADSLGSINAIATGGNTPYTYILNFLDSQNSGLFEDLTSGNYSITVQDENTCFVTTTTSIEEESFLSVEVTSQDISCYNAADGSIFVDPSAGSPNYIISVGTNSSSNTNGSYTATNLDSDNYVVSVIDDNGCSFDTVVTIIEPTEILLTFDGVIDVNCFDSNDGSIEISFSGGSGTLNYRWQKDGFLYANTTITNINSLSPGAYSVYAEDANGCSSQTIDTLLMSPDELIIQVDSSSNPLCFESSDGYISVSAQGGRVPYSFGWFGDTIINSPGPNIINNLYQGTYEVVVTDFNNCSDTLTNIELTQPLEMDLNTISLTNVDCFGESSGQISVEVTNGIGPYIFTSSSSTGNQSTSNQTFELINIISGQYEISVTDNNSCTVSEIYQIDQNSEIQATFSNIISETCNNNNGEVTAIVSGGTPGYSYNWQSGQTSQTATSLSGNENILLQVTDALNCVQNFSVFVPSTNTIEITSITETDNLCNGDNQGELEVVISGSSSPFIYSLSNVPDINSSLENATFSNLSAGNYNLSVTDADGCTIDYNSTISIQDVDSITVEVDNSSTTMLECNGDSNGEIFLNISGGNPFPGGYYLLFVNDPNFSQQISSDSITGLPAGTYNLSIQDANGCLQTVTHEILEPDPISVVQQITPATCFDGDNGEALIIISGGTTSYSLTSNISSINFNQVSQDSYLASGLSEGVFFYDIVDQNGCDLLNNTFYISQPSQLEVINISSEIESCLGWDATASVSVVGGIEPYTYLWSYDINYQQPLQLENNVLNPTANNSQVEFLTEGLYYIHVWDFNSCYIVDSIYISSASSPTLSLIGTVNNLCHDGSNGQISLTANGGTPFYEYSINGGLNWQFSTTFSGLLQGFYDIMLRDSLGCTDVIQDIEVAAPSPISVDISSNNVSCLGSTDGSASAISVFGGTPSTSGYSYSWQNENGVNLWPGNSSAINSTVDNLMPGTYQLEVEDNNGCTSLYSPVIIGEPLDVSIELSTLSDYNGMDVSCYESSDGIILANIGGGSGLYTIEWFDAESNDLQSNMTSGFDTLSFLSSGNYTAVVTDSRGCVDSANILIDGPDSISVTFEDVINIRCEGSSDGEATAIFSGGIGFGNYSLVWTDSQNNIISLSASASNLSIGDYNVSVTDNNGCVGFGSISINYSELLNTSNLNDVTSVSCFGAIDASFNFDVVGGWPPYSYEWNDPLNQQSATAVGLAPYNWYTNIITDSEGCIIIDSVYVDSPVDLVEITSFTTQDNNCFGESLGAIDIQVSGGTPNYNFQWIGPNGFTSNNKDILGLSKGVYNVVVFDASGCEIAASYEVDGPDSPLSINYVETTNVSCFGLDDGTATINTSLTNNQVTGGTPPYLNIDWGGENPNTLSAGNYTVSVTDANECISSSNFNIYEPIEYSISIDVLNEYCEGQNGSIITSVAGGTPFNDGSYNYSIEPISGISPNFNYQLSTVNEPNIEIDFPFENDISDTLFLLSITDANGCLFTQEIEIHPSRLFNYNASVGVCYGDTLKLDASMFDSYDTYSWFVDPNQEILNQNSSASLVVTNPLTISVIASDYSSVCSFEDEINIIVLYPSITATDDFGIVRGQSATISIIDGEPPYLWSTTETTSDVVVSPIITTEYIAYALDTLTECIGSDTVRVFVGMNEGFSPNGDGYNDSWEISYLNQYPSTKIEIFNRWGTSLWSSSYPNIENWDGKYNNKDLPVGTYYYIITFDSSLDIEPLTGPVTIVR